MNNIIYDLIIITIIGGVIVGIILLAIGKINFKTLFLKFRIRRIIKRYDEIKQNPEEERKKVVKLGQLLDKGQEKLARSGYGTIRDTIKNNLFSIHLTRVGETKIIDNFLIRRLEDDRVYFSDKYPENQKERNDISVLLDFVENL